MNWCAIFLNIPLLGVLITLLFMSPIKCNTENHIIQFYSDIKHYLEVTILLLSGHVEYGPCEHFEELKNYGATIWYISFPEEPNFKFPAAGCVHDVNATYQAFITLVKIDNQYKYVLLNVVDTSHEYRMTGTVKSVHDYPGPQPDLKTLTINYFRSTEYHDAVDLLLPNQEAIMNDVCKAFGSQSDVNLNTLLPKNIKVGDYQLTNLITVKCGNAFRIAYVHPGCYIFMKIGGTDNKFLNIMRYSLPPARAFYSMSN